MSKNEHIEAVRQQSIEIDTFSWVNISAMKCPSIAVFIKPEDYPDDVIARIFEGEQPTNIVLIRKTLEEVRKDIMTAFPGMVRFDRSENDCASIAETWL